MIDENKTVVLVDFDRLIEANNNKIECTSNFAQDFIAPEIILT